MDVNAIEDALSEYFSEGVEAFLPHISVNCVVLVYRHPRLQVLVHKIYGQEFRLLPGGYVKKTESIDEAAYRNLSLMGIKEVFLRQIQTFGDVKRVMDPTDLDFLELKINEDVQNWAKQRFVTVVYYGLINLSSTHVVPGGLMSELEWLDIDDVDKLAMDHAEIVSEIRKLLATELLNHPVVANLLPETFTLKELRGLFEAILLRPVDRGTFRRKMLKLDIIHQVDQQKDKQGRPSHIYSFNKDNYNRFLEEENKFGF